MNADLTALRAVPASVPRTMPRLYLSGYTALNIPSPENTGSDCHLDTALLHQASRFYLAGEGPGARVNTFALLGNAGICECGAVLLDLGTNVQAGEPVYAASHHRAIVDFLVGQARGQRRLDLLDPAELLDGEDQMAELGRWLDRWQKQAASAEHDFIRAWRAKHRLWRLNSPRRRALRVFASHRFPC